MPSIKNCCDYLDVLAPRTLAEDWDNVGLLVGDTDADVNRIMTCLTITPESAQEAIDEGADLIVAHHPLPFRPLKRLTTGSTPGRLLLQLIRAGIGIYSPHTGFDSAMEGINQQLAKRFGCDDITPLIPASPDLPEVGCARIGVCERNSTFGECIERAKSGFQLNAIQYVGDLKRPVHKMAFACGSGGSFFDEAVRKGCDTFVTGETNFHTCLEARAASVNLLLLGHHASERFALEVLADRLQSEFDDIKVWASRQESDPVQWA